MENNLLEPDKIPQDKAASVCDMQSREDRKNKEE